MAASNAWYRATLAVGVAGVVWLLAAALANPTPWAAAFVGAAVVAVVFLAYAPPQDRAHTCRACGRVADPVRSVSGRRLWTCRMCGHERPRRRTRGQLEAGKPPKATG